MHQQLYDAQVKQKVGTGHLNSLVIPDTIVFRVGHAGYPLWYLSSVSEPGLIKRKNSSNVTPRNILDAFTRRKTKRSVQHAGSSGIIAVLVSDAHQNDMITEEDQVGSATVEYLDEVLLRDFLERRAVKFSGILQKWVDPKGQNNSMIHATWTPTMCKVTCLTNVKSMSDRRSTMYERAVTFDGADSFTRRDPVSSTVHGHIAHLCKGISKHVSVITDAECDIQRSTSYFKVRHDGKVVYMWSSSLRVDSDRTAHALLGTRTYSPVMGVPHTMDTNFDMHRERNYVCPVSNKVCSWNEAKTFITYKMIIQEWNAHFPRDASGQENYRPSSARFRPSSAGTPRQAPSGVVLRRSTSSRPGRPTDADAPGDAGVGAPDGQPAQVAGRAVYTGRVSHAAPANQTLTPQNCVPELIRKLENITDVELYRRLLKDPTFLYKQVRVCSEVAQAYSKLASAQCDHAAGGSRQGLGHFLDDLPLQDSSVVPAKLPAGARTKPEDTRKSRSAPAHATSASLAGAKTHAERQPLLPKLDLGGRLLGKQQLAAQDASEAAPKAEEESNRKAADMEQHKRRLEAARLKAQRQSMHRFGCVPQPQREKGRQLPSSKPASVNIFTDWKKECKQDDQRLDSLKVILAEGAGGAVTERARPTPPAAQAPAPPLSARPPNSARSGVSRAARQFVVVPSAANEQMVSELAYHQEQAAMQKKFLDQMILETKRSLNIGAEAHGSTRGGQNAALPTSHNTAHARDASGGADQSFACGSDDQESAAGDSAAAAHGRPDDALDNIQERDSCRDAVSAGRGLDLLEDVEGLGSDYEEDYGSGEEQEEEGDDDGGGGSEENEVGEKAARHAGGAEAATPIYSRFVLLPAHGSIHTLALARAHS